MDFGMGAKHLSPARAAKTTPIPQKALGKRGRKKSTTDFFNNLLGPRLTQPFLDALDHVDEARADFLEEVFGGHLERGRTAIDRHRGQPTARAETQRNTIDVGLPF